MIFFEHGVLPYAGGILPDIFFMLICSIAPCINANLLCKPQLWSAIEGHASFIVIIVDGQEFVHCLVLLAQSVPTKQY